MTLDYRAGHQRTPRSNWSTKSRHERGYGAHWTKLRTAKLAADPLCQPCLAKGKTTAATQVDHRKPKGKGGTDDWDNLQSICVDCHKAKTLAESLDARGLGVKGCNEDGMPTDPRHPWNR